MSEFKIYSSSAGSGKTYTLTLSYLKLLLQSDDPFYYRHILAVTFTNDAAAEMKHRILNALKNLGKETNSPGVTGIKESLLASIPDLNEKTLRERARKCFANLLEDYGNFHIKTIDSFVNQLVSTFSRDLNLPYNYEIILDKAPVLLQAVDRVFDRVGRPQEEYLTNLLIDFASEYAEEGKNWKNIRQNLAEFAGNLFNDQYYHLIRKTEELDFGDYRQIKKQIDQRIAVVKNLYLETGKKGQQILTDYSLSVEEFSFGKGGFAGLFIKTLDPENELLSKDWSPGVRIENAIESGIFYSKSAPEFTKNKLDAASERLIEWYHELKNFLTWHKPPFVLMLAVRKNLDNLSLLQEVNREFQKILAENNQAYITDFNRRINALIAAEPVPYVYERMGEKFHHILIDEFQDTSDIQFYNLLPLIENSLAGNHFNMLVGDPKQSIYRWRGGKVDLMLQLMNQNEPALHDNTLLTDFQRESVSNTLKNITVSSLQSNYRSSSQIIAFNNSLFSMLLEDTKEPKLQQALQDVLQLKHAGTLEGGHADLRFYDKAADQDEETWMLNEIELRIREAIQAGFSMGDIAILCRKKKQAARVARNLSSAGFEISSADSLLIRNNDVVRFVISLFEAYSDPSFSSLAVLNFYKIQGNTFPSELDYRKIDIWEHLRSKGFSIDPDKIRTFGLYQMTESLIQTLGLFDPGPHLPYLFAFLDLIQDFAKNKGNDLRGFLKHWPNIKENASVDIKNPNAIIVSTIHKSKGLEYPVVILPFANWSFKPKNNSLGWFDLEHCDLPEFRSASKRLLAAPFNLTSKSLDLTLLRSQRAKELELQKLEEINSLYVALTRPVERLHLLSASPHQQAEDSVYGILQKFAYGFMTERDSNYFILSEEKRKLKKSKVEDKETELILEKLTSKENLGNLRIQSNLDVLFNQNNQRDRGILIHTLFSEIRVATDLKRALNKLRTEGLIMESEKADLEKEALEILKTPGLQHLFEGEIQVENERDILQKNQTASRPDRVVHHNGQVTIIDYKTGIALESHARQLKHYGLLYREMGYPQVNLLLIYFNPTRLVPVNF